MRYFAVRVAAVAAVVVSLLGAAGGSQPALAHEGDGTIELLSAQSSGARQVRYVVRVTFEEDGHVADEATVTAVGQSDGQKVGPVQMDLSSDGQYEGLVEFPTAGEWTVRFTSIDPPATLEQAEVVSEVASPTPVATPLETTPISDSSSTSRRWLAIVVAGVVGAALLGGAIFVFVLKPRQNGQAHE